MLAETNESLLVKYKDRWLAAAVARKHQSDVSVAILSRFVVSGSMQLNP